METFPGRDKIVQQVEEIKAYMQTPGLSVTDAATMGQMATLAMILVELREMKALLAILAAKA